METKEKHGFKILSCHGSLGGQALFVGDDELTRELMPHNLTGYAHHVTMFPLTVADIAQAIKELRAVRKRMVKKQEEGLADEAPQIPGPEGAR